MPSPAFGVKCAEIEVPLDHTDPGGPTFSLRVARHPSLSFPSGKAIFMLAGGPGGSAVEQSGLIPKLMPELKESFDLIYVDQRGTGGSGRLNCTSGYPKTDTAWRFCGGEHDSKPLALYSTVTAAHDIDLIRQRLGYQQIYLRGGSYGTRLGLEFMRQHPQSIAAVVLDGLVPPDWDFYGWLIKDTDEAVAELVSECALDAACQAISPTLEGDILDRLTALKAQPRAIRLDGQPYEEDDVTYAIILMSILDTGILRYKVPRAIRQAASGDNSLWNELISLVFGYTVTDAVMDGVPPPEARSPRGARPRWRPIPRVNPARATLGGEPVAAGLYMSIRCSEFLPNAQGGIPGLSALAAEQIWPGADQIAEEAGACDAWVAPVLGPELLAPVSSAVKTLLMSGGVDISTPPALGEHTVQGLSNGTHLVVPFTGHSTNFDPCAAKIIASFFINDGEMGKVDTSCIQAMTHPDW